MHYLLQRLDSAATTESAATREHLVEQAAEREDVGAVIDHPALDLLRRHVANGAHDLPLHGADHRG